MSNFLEEAARRIEASGGILYSIAESNGLTVRKYDSRLGSACRNSYSVAKSFAVAAVGLLYDEGKIDTDERIVDIFSGITMEFLTTVMRSGAIVGLVSRNSFFASSETKTILSSCL